MTNEEIHVRIGSFHPEMIVIAQGNFQVVTACRDEVDALIADLRKARETLYDRAYRSKKKDNPNP